MESYSGCIDVYCLSRTFIESPRFAVELGLGIDGEIGSLWEVLPPEAICVFVGTALPGMLRLAEVETLMSVEAGKRL